eukprot:g74588.t1
MDMVDEAAKNSEGEGLVQRAAQICRSRSRLDLALDMMGFQGLSVSDDPSGCFVPRRSKRGLQECNNQHSTVTTADCG